MNAVSASTPFGPQQEYAMTRDLEAARPHRHDLVAGWHFEVPSPNERRGSVITGADKGWMSKPGSPVQSPVGTSEVSRAGAEHSRTDHSISGANGRSPPREERTDRLTLSPIQQVGDERNERRLSHVARQNTSSPRSLEPSLTGSNRSQRTVQHIAKPRGLAGYTEVSKAASPGNAKARESGRPVVNDSPEVLLKRSREVTE